MVVIYDIHFLTGPDKKKDATLRRKCTTVISEGSDVDFSSDVINGEAYSLNLHSSEWEGINETIVEAANSATSSIATELVSNIFLSSI